MSDPYRDDPAPRKCSKWVRLGDVILQRKEIKYLGVFANTDSDTKEKHPTVLQVVMKDGQKFTIYRLESLEDAARQLADETE